MIYIPGEHIPPGTGPYPHLSDKDLSNRLEALFGLFLGWVTISGVASAMTWDLAPFIGGFAVSVIAVAGVGAFGLTARRIERERANRARQKHADNLAREMGL